MGVKKQRKKMKKFAYSVKELANMGLGSQSHIRRMIKAGEIPVVKLGNRDLVPSWWVEENFNNPDAA